MTSASIRYRAHVPGDPSASIVNPVAVRTCARLRWRAHSDINPGSQQAINPASHQSTFALRSERGVIAAVPPFGSGNWGRTVEHGGPSICAPVRPRFFPTRRDMWSGILNFCRAFKAAGKPAFLPLVHDANQASGSFLKSFEVSKVLSSSRAAHVPNMMQKDARSHEQCTREYE